MVSVINGFSLLSVLNDSETRTSCVSTKSLKKLTAAKRASSRTPGQVIVHDTSIPGACPTQSVRPKSASTLIISSFHGSHRVVTLTRGSFLGCMPIYRRGRISFGIGDGLYLSNRIRRDSDSLTSQIHNSSHACH